MRHEKHLVIKTIFRYLNYLKRPSVIALILANTVPLMGVLFWQWNLFNIVFLYWLETGIMGFFNIFKIQMAKLEDEKPITLVVGVMKKYKPHTSQFSDDANYEYGKETIISKKYYPLVFITKLLPFMAMHGIFIYGVLYIFPLFRQFESSAKILDYPTIPTINFSPDFIYSLLVLFISHGISFFYNFVWKKEYLNVSPQQQMDMYDQRLVVMHLTLLFGAFLINIIGSSIVLLAVMVVIKIKLDIDAHINRHQSLKIGNVIS